jgi:precorrin-6B methylase 2
MSNFLKAIGAIKIANSNKKFVFEGKGVFKPTATTYYILHHLSKQQFHNKKILDLGCGSGIIGIEILLNKPEIKHMYFSDLSLEASKVCLDNVVEFSLFDKSTIRHGSLFEPWNSFKFDLIINDVSGISNKIPFLSDWFEDIPVDSGDSGVELFQEILSKTSKYLEDKGKLITPVISLSSVNKAHKVIENSNLVSKVLGRHEWSRKVENDKEFIIMNDLLSEGLIDFTIDRDKYVFYTEILQIERINNE